MYDALKAASQTQFKHTSSGKNLIQVSANGHYYTFDIPQDSNPADIAELLDELLTRYDEAEEYLIEEEDIETPTDTQLFNEMMRCLVAVSSVTFDFGGSRDGGEESD